MHQANLAITRDRELASRQYSFFNLALGAIKQSLYFIRIEADFGWAVGEKVRCGHQGSPWFAAKLKGLLIDADYRSGSVRNSNPRVWVFIRGNVRESVATKTVYSDARVPLFEFESLGLLS
jgi:hypothetical protein